MDMAWVYAAKPRTLPMPYVGGRTSSVKTWLLLYTDAKLDIYICYTELFMYASCNIHFATIYTYI
jgi:hypothetical protein